MQRADDSRKLPPPGAGSAGAAVVLRDPQPMLHRVLAEWGGHDDLWLFGYASLIWRPEFPAAERRPAQVLGWHRALQMHSRINRGTPEQPGLVFALVPGGSCRGMAYRLPREEADEQLRRLWLREMPTGVYDPRWLACRTAAGPVRALAFTLSRRSPSFTGPIDDARLVHILRHARGRYGSTLDYVVETARALRAQGMPDRGLERTVALARAHGLVAGGGPD